MNIENNDVLRGWLREHGYAALAELPSFEVPEEEYEKHLADVRAQGLHSDEGANQARAVYRCLTTHLGGSEKRPAAQDSIATHLDRAARQFNQSVAVLAGKTEAHEQTIKKAVDEILEDSLCRHENISGRLRELAKVQASGLDDLHVSIEGTFGAIRELLGRHVARLLWTIVLGFALVLALLGFMAVMGHAQAGQPDAGRGNLPSTGVIAAKSASKPEPAPNLAVAESYKLRIRDAQYSQDRILIRLQNLQLEVQKAQGEAQNQGRTINDIVYQLALDNHIDLSKWVFDLDALNWRPKDK